MFQSFGEVVENILVSALALISPLSPLEVLEGKQSDTVQSVKIPNVASTSLATFLCSLDVEILDDNLVVQLTTTVRHSLATQGKKSNIFSHKWQLQIFTTISPP